MITPGDDCGHNSGDVLVAVHAAGAKVAAQLETGVAMQAARIPKIPGPDHPIVISACADRVVVKVAGRIVIDTRAALLLKEASYPAVYYLPRKDADMALLAKTDHATYCPYKGECSYYSIPTGGERSKNAVWTYESPYASVIQIREHLAFYPDRVDSIELSPL
jgi:uncharacterized protein (DUF427 family)